MTWGLSRLNRKGRNVMFISEMNCYVYLPVREHPYKSRVLSLESEDRVAKTLTFTVYVTHRTRGYIVNKG